MHLITAVLSWKHTVYLGNLAIDMETGKLFWKQNIVSKL